MLLTLSACASLPTAYRPLGPDGGYAEQQLDGRTWRVRFDGNESTSRETVENYLLYRAAEIMRFGGYRKFVLLEKDVERDVRYWGSGYGPALGAGWGTGDRLGVTYQVPLSYRPVDSYRATAVIRVYEGGPAPANAVIYDAEELIRTLRPVIVFPPVK